MKREPHATKKGPGRRHKDGATRRTNKGKPALYPTKRGKG